MTWLRVLKRTLTESEEQENLAKPLHLSHKKIHFYFMTLSKCYYQVPSRIVHQNFLIILKHKINRGL